MSDLTIVPLDVDRDIELLHAWVTHPKATFWLMQGYDRDAVRAAYAGIEAHPHHDAFLGLADGVPAFLVERYDPAVVELVGLYDPLPGDVGMHFLTAPSSEPVAGFTRRVITTVVAWLFDNPSAQRVVVEPDVQNTAVHALNAAVGFQVVGTIRKPEKDALLSVCTRAQFLHATRSVSC